MQIQNNLPHTVYVVYSINRDVIGVATDIHQAQRIYEKHNLQSEFKDQYEKFVLNT